MRIYMAGGLFTVAEKMFNRALAAGLRARGHEVWLPQEHQYDSPEDTFQGCLAGVDWCEVVAANMDGSDPDSGTAAECGIAYHSQPVRSVLAYRTDFRAGGESETGAGYNLMLWGIASARLDLSYVHVLTDPIPAIVEAIDLALSQMPGCSRSVSGSSMSVPSALLVNS